MAIDAGRLRSASSPRTRGYFRNLSTKNVNSRLFPAHAGVFPGGDRRDQLTDALPRARGGISKAREFIALYFPSSPRTRGYFRPGKSPTWSARLFPAHAGVFPIGKMIQAIQDALPRARGGISRAGGEILRVNASSPRTRGYFQRHYYTDRPMNLFPAHAGVFPCECDRHFCRPPLPRARGGISQIRIGDEPWETSSPRTRGYFPREEPIEPNPSLFPAHAGVFPT